MFRRVMSLFMIPILLLLSVCNVTVVHAEEVNNLTNDAVSFRGYEFQSYEPGEDDAKLYMENGTLIYAIDKLSLEDWQNKVFIDSGVNFEKGKQYTVDFTISASNDTYFSFFVNQIGAWNPAISQSLNIGNYQENYSYTTPVINEDMAMEVLFQFGGYGNQVPLKISISDFAIYEAAPAEETTSVNKVADFHGLSVSSEGAAGSNLYIEGNGLVFETAEDGKVKIGDVSFKKGCDYEIAYTVRADKNAQLACSVDPMGGYFAPGTFISLSGAPQTVSRRTGIQQTDRQMEITFDIRKAWSGKAAKIVFDQIVVKEIKDGQEQISRNAWVVDGFQLNHDESGGAAADLDMDEEGNIVYRIEKIGENDWNNKVMIDRDVTFVKGNSYKVDITLETDKEISAFFGVNPKNKWEPKISETLRLKEGVNNFSFTTDTQAYDEDMEVLFQFGGYGNTAPCNVKIKAVSITPASAEDIAAVAAEHEAVMEPILSKQYDFSKLDNYKFKGFAINDPSGSELYLEQGVLVYDIRSFGVNQLSKKDLWLSKNSLYDIEMEVSASRPMNVECYVSDKGSQKALCKSTRTVGSSVEVIKAGFTTGDTEGQGRLVFDLSNNQESGKFYVHSITVKAIEGGSETTFPMDLLDLDDPDIIRTDSKSNATATLVDGGLRYAVKRFGGNPWENKITLNNIADFKKDKTYVVEFDMSSTESMVFTCFMHNLECSDGDDGWEYFWERNHILGGKKQHFRYSFKASSDNAVNEMIFELGGQGNNKKSAGIFISDIKITQCENYRNETIKFPGAEGVFSYEHNGSSASGKLYQENGVLIYEIGREGIADWHNQLIFNQGITFEEGYRYRIDVTASANKNTNMKFLLVSQADWSEKIKKYSILSTKEATFSYETDTIQDNDENMEFSLRFGGMYNQGNITVRISDIKIYKINPKIACTDTAFDDDLEIEYENSDFYESVDFKGYTFNSTLIGSADASLYQSSGVLHYEIRELGSETYHNKLSINRELTAKADKNYIFEITARADNPMKFFFAANGTDGEWNPLVAETISLTEEYCTYTFRTGSQDVDKELELIFEFGANGNTAPNQVYIKDFKISEVNDIVDEGTVTFKEKDFTHEETGENAKGILYTNDDGNMVYYAKQLGNTPDDNTVSTSATLKGDKDSKIEITLKPQKGLDVSVKVIDAASKETISTMTEWTGDNEEKKLALSVPAQGADREVIVAVMFGQKEWAEARGDNRIAFTDFSITESEPVVDEGTVIFGEGEDTYEFTHEESDTAKGILYLDDDGNMVYYAEKLGSLDWHNKVSTVIKDVEAGAQYTLKVEVELEKGLDMVTTIPNAKNAQGDGDAWFRNWVGENTTNTLSYTITAQSDTLEVFFQFGQENFADARENNHIVFKSISLKKNAPVVDEGKVIFGEGNYEFAHEESGDTAKGSLYKDGDTMIYYAEKLGNTPGDNTISMPATLNANKDSKIEITLRPQKGLDVSIEVHSVTGREIICSENVWIGDNEEKTIRLSVPAQDSERNIKLLVMFGQKEWAEARSDNRIAFTNFSITEDEPVVDESTVIFGEGDYTFKHEESGDIAKGSLSLDADGNMVYYAEKLSSTDWHNKVFTVINDVESGAQYTLTAEIELEKGLDMVTTIPNAKKTEDGTDAWFRDWLSPDAPTTLTKNIIVRENGDLEIFFQFGQENFADGREDNHIVFKSFSIEKVDAAVSSLDEEDEPEEKNLSNEQTSDKSDNPDHKEDVTAPVENDDKESENNGEDAKQEQEGTGTDSSVTDTEEGKDTDGKAPAESDDHGGESDDNREESEGNREESEDNREESEDNREESEQKPEETGTDSSVTDDEESKDTDEKDSAESENTSEDTKQEPEETETDSSAADAEGKKDKDEETDKDGSEKSEDDGGETQQQPERTEINSPAASDVLKKEEEDAVM